MRTSERIGALGESTAVQSRRCRSLAHAGEGGTSNVCTFPQVIKIAAHAAWSHVPPKPTCRQVTNAAAVPPPFILPSTFLCRVPRRRQGCTTRDTRKFMRVPLRCMWHELASERGGLTSREAGHGHSLRMPLVRGRDRNLESSGARRCCNTDERLTTASLTGGRQWLSAILRLHTYRADFRTRRPLWRTSSRGSAFD